MTELADVTVHVSVRADADADDSEIAEMRDQVRSMLAEHELDVTGGLPAAPAPAAAKGIQYLSARWSWCRRRLAAY